MLSITSVTVPQLRIEQMQNIVMNGLLHIGVDVIGCVRLIASVGTMLLLRVHMTVCERLRLSTAEEMIW